MAEIRIGTAGGDYRVFVGRGVYEKSLAAFLARRRPEKLVIVSHPRIMRLHGDRLEKALGEAYRPACKALRFLFPEGERNKSMSTLQKGYRFLLEHEVNREDLILAFGGGVVGDLAGFLASSYMRGIDYLQLPTTLMAMVDSSIGGKVGLDLPGAKNAVGAFYQPRAVFCDLDVLDTLPRREMRSGMAEVAKYGFLYDAGLLRFLKEWTATHHNPRKVPETVVTRCAELKAAAVEKDERDRSGVRAMLNYGHTFGHALESSTGYGLLRHGEAVALGMIMAARASELAGLSKKDLMEEHLSVLAPLLKGGMPYYKLDLAVAMEHMKRDKKRGRQVRFVLLEEPQKPRLVESLPSEVIKKAMRESIEALRRA